jgi:isoleucyl-tRNA synthetase
MSAFTPFMSENIYLRLKQFLPPALLQGDTQSVHFLLYPQVRQEFFDEVIQRKVRRMSTILSLGRKIREKEEINFRVEFFQHLD